MVFQDETGFSLHPRLGRGWAKRGHSFRIPTTSQHRQHLNLSGWVAPLLGRFGMIRTERGNRQGFIKILAHLYRRLRNSTIWSMWIEPADIEASRSTFSSEHIRDPTWTIFRAINRG